MKQSQKKARRTVEPVAAEGRPTNVRIGYRDIAIEWIKPDFRTDVLTDCYGWYLPREGKIQMQDSLDPQETANTLFHEILHAVVYGSGLNQANGPLKEEDAEELTVNQMTNYIIAAFRDNPWLMDFIKSHMDKQK